MMSVFERTLIVETSSSASNTEKSEKKFTTIPEEAEGVLVSVLKRYEQLFLFYYSHIDEKLFPEPPWALCFFDEEQPIAGHFTTNNFHGSGVLFTPYDIQAAMIDGAVPQVGVIVFQDKVSAEQAATRSPLFDLLWNDLKDLDSDRYWLSLPSMPEDLVSQLSQNNGQLWLDNKK